MSKKQITLPEGITQEMIDQAKEKNGADNVRISELPLDDDNDKMLPVLMRRPPRAIIGEFEKYEEAAPGRAKEIMVNGTLLSHKDRVKADDDLFLSAFSAAVDLLPMRSAIISDLPEDGGKLPEGITAEMVTEAKQNHSSVKLAKIFRSEKENDSLIVLVGRPGRNAINTYEKWASSMPNKAKNALIKGTLLSHQEEVNANDWLWLGAFSAGVQMMAIRKAVIKNC